MARTVRDAKLEKRASRLNLAVRKEPYYRLVEPGLHLGYRRLASGPGTWLVRRTNDGDDARSPYTRTNLTTAGGDLVLADDYSEANGVGILTFAQAQTAAKARRPETMKAKGPYTVTDALKDYFAGLREEGRAEDLVLQAEQAATALIEPKLGKIEVDTLTTKRLRKWRDELVKTAPRLRTKKGQPQKFREIGNDAESLRKRRSSANRLWTILRAALNRAWKEGAVPSDAEWRRVSPFKGVDGVRIRWLTVAQAKRAINAADADFRKIVIAGLQTGGRYGAVTTLRVRDFHERAGVVDLRTRKGDGSERVFPVRLTDEGVRFFRSVCAGRADDELMFTKADGTPWGKSDQARPMREISERANIKPAVSYGVLRHSWASNAVMRGTPLMVVAQNLGHTSTRMCEKHYGHLAPNYVADAIKEGAPRFGAAASNVHVLRPRKSA